MNAPFFQSLHDLMGNRTLWVPVLLAVGVQVWKFLYTLIFERRFEPRQMWSVGGMPSSHTALVASLAMSVGMNTGFGSASFAVAVGLAIVVMFDAAGIRQAAGKQAEKINQIVEELFSGHPLNEEQLRELLGHTPLQVMVGAVVGVLGGWLLNL